MNDTYIDVNTGEQVEAWHYTERTNLRQLVEHLPVDNVSIFWETVPFYTDSSRSINHAYSSHLLLTNFATPGRLKMVLSVHCNSWIIMDALKNVQVLSDSLFKRFYK